MSASPTPPEPTASAAALAAPTPAATPGASVHVVLVAVQLAFASLPVAGKLAMREIPSSAVALVRIAVAAAAFVAWRAARGPWPRLGVRDVALLTACSVLGIAGNQLLFLTGLARTTAVNAAVLTASIPVGTVAIAAALGRERVTARRMLGVGVACAGVLWLVGAEGFRLDATTLAGDLLIVANALAYAAYLVIVREPIARLGAGVVVPVVFAVGAVLTLPVGVVDLVRAAPLLSARAWWLLAYVVLVPTIFTYGANAWALGRAPSSLVAVYIYAQPVATALLAVAVLGEPLSARAVVAGALVLTGIAVATSGPSR
jgi:drug/metabolite transporter (DMT)-like permease